MKAITAFLLWIACLVVFLIGLKIQEETFEKNYLTIEAEDIIR
jgi:hypothetical protein